MRSDARAMLIAATDADVFIATARDAALSFSAFAPRHFRLLRWRPPAKSLFIFFFHYECFLR